MKRLLILTGDVAAGKSTFAEILSKRYQTNVFYKDKIKEVLGDVIGFSNREENLKLSDAAVQLMIRTFEEFAKLEKSLILEANFHKRELQQLQDIAKTYDYEVMTLVLEAVGGVMYWKGQFSLEHLGKLFVRSPSSGGVGEA